MLYCAAELTDPDVSKERNAFVFKCGGVLDSPEGLYFRFYGGAHTEETGFKQLTLSNLDFRLPPRC
jgi:hypothetical protein